MLHAVIGDVHGCADEYSTLLDELENQFPGIKIIQVGDLIHKGPSSNDCVTLTRERVNTLVLGNHELKHLRWLGWEAKIADTPKTNPMKNVSSYPDVQLSDINVDYLKQGRLYYQSNNLVVIHAGVLSSVQRLPTCSKYFELEKKQQNYYKTMTMTRFENLAGKMVPLGCETPEDTWWAAKYDGRFGYAVYGHQHTLAAEPVEYPHALGIDLGCVYGGYLCAVIVSDGMAVETVKISAAQQYCQPLNWSKK